MLFVIEYNRPKAETVYMRRYADDHYEDARKERFARELALFVRGDDDHTEVTLLQARDEALLRRTHARYFGGRSDILDHFSVHEAANAYGNSGD